MGGPGGHFTHPTYMIMSESLDYEIYRHGKGYEGKKREFSAISLQFQRSNKLLGIRGTFLAFRTPEKAE